MSGFNIRNNPYPSLAYRWGGSAPGFRGLGDFLAHPGLGDDGTTTNLSLSDPFGLSTANLVTDPSQLMTGPSFPGFPSASSTPLPSLPNISAQDVQNYFNGTAGPDVVA